MYSTPFRIAMGNCFESEKTDSVITYFLKVMAIMDMPAQIMSDDVPEYVSKKMKQFLLIII